MHHNGDTPGSCSTMELRCRINSYGFGRDFTAWARRELMKIKIELYGLSKDDREHELTVALHAFLSRIKERDPPDPRLFAERRFLRMRLDRDLVEMGQDVFSLAPGDERAASSLEQAVERLIQRAERDFPSFREENEGLLMGFRNALRSHTDNKKGRFSGPEKVRSVPVKQLRTSR